MVLLFFSPPCGGGGTLGGADDKGAHYAAPRDVDAQYLWVSSYFEVLFRGWRRLAEAHTCIRAEML